MTWRILLRPWCSARGHGKVVTRFTGISLVYWETKWFVCSRCGEQIGKRMFNTIRYLSDARYGKTVPGLQSGKTIAQAAELGLDLEKWMDMKQQMSAEQWRRETQGDFRVRKEEK